MSSNSQWKIFQPPDSQTSPLRDIDHHRSNMQSKQPFRNGTHSNEFPSSPRDNLSNQMMQQGGNHFSLGNYSHDACPMGDSIGVFSTNSTNNSSQYDAVNHPPIRETGIIEKLLHSYGFIQCCERQARLFFHFSQFSGNIEHLKIGDPVEFEMTYDRRTGKPIASTVTKIAPEVVTSEARVTGTVTTEVKGEGSGDSTGRISYENRGECFFLPYTKDDVEGNVTLRTGDSVSFQIATNQRGTLGACHVRLENPVHPVKYHGVVCSMKDNFGFIERADVVKEIFFHYSESRVKEELFPGDDVEFLIQTRYGKEVACNITKLPSGSVVFEDVSPELMRGQVLKPLERVPVVRQHSNDPLPGRIRYRAADHSEVEVPFGDKDQCSEFTLRHGDWVQFQVTTDRRDQLKRAINITLLEESFSVSGEKREQGVVSSLCEGYGFIKCVLREQDLFFYFSEVLRQGHCSVGDEVDFTVDPVSTLAKSKTRQSAIRIRHLPSGTVEFETLVQRNLQGLVVKEAPPYNSDSPLRTAPPEFQGVISLEINGSEKLVFYSNKAMDKDAPKPRAGDNVIFDVYMVKRTKQLFAMSVTPVAPAPPNGSAIASNGSAIASNGAAVDSDGGAVGCDVGAVASDGGAIASDGGAVASNGNSITSNGNTSTFRSKGLTGYITALKDGYGFIETCDLEQEVFFHFSHVEDYHSDFEVGTEVEFKFGGRTSKARGCDSAEFVRVLPRNTLPVAKALEPTMNGVVIRTLRSLNPNQKTYAGLIQSDDGRTFKYGIMGLAYIHEILQLGDQVLFQVDTDKHATNIVPLRKKIRGTVDSIKGLYGFLSFADCGENRRVFFHMSEVRGNPSELQLGDLVEFVLVTNTQSRKTFASNVVKICPKSAAVTRLRNERPERLAVRLRTGSVEEAAGPRVILVRTPRGPDDSRGFRARL